MKKKRGQEYGSTLYNVSLDADGKHPQVIQFVVTRNFADWNKPDEMAVMMLKYDFGMAHSVQIYQVSQNSYVAMLISPQGR